MVREEETKKWIGVEVVVERPLYAVSREIS